MTGVRTIRSRAATVGVLSGAVSGLLAAAAALGAGQACSLAFGAESAPVIAVGEGAIDLTPSWLKDFAVSAFGSNDKLVLLSGIGAVVVLIAVAIGLVARRRLAWGAVGIAGFGAVGVVAALARPTASLLFAVPSLVAAVVGVVALLMLIRRAPRAKTAGSPVPDGDRVTSPSGADRRAFLFTASGTVVFAGLAGGTGLLLRGGAAATRAAVRLPRPASPAQPLPAGTELRIPGISPYITPLRDFYRVDTALVLPQVDPRDWKLRIHGMVDRPMELTLAQLLKYPLVERWITLTCVSNQVGGPYAGNGRWLGVPLARLLRAAGVRAGADQVLSKSVDGFTAGTPVATVLDGRDALLAVGLDGEPLPVARGFPARLIVPGLYGFVSATKWVTDLKITRFADDRSYWARRGWALRAPIKTMSRIDVPRPLANVPAGEVTVAGVAWAQHRGVTRVQVRADDGPWENAELASVPSTDTWRQWHYRWAAKSGQHTLTVRATDATGAVQTQERVPPIPDGASGWQSIVVTVA
jgi:DMSO/TMAO reductase YedYZ molybdopterin-dependent catalytic subunit